MDIDSQFTDVDFSRDPRFVYGDQGKRTFAASRRFADSIIVLSPTEINEAIERLEAEGGGLERLIVEVKDQKQEGSCVGNATTQANQIVQGVQLGKDGVTVLSAISLYKQIGSSPQSGAVVSDALEAMQTVGCLPLDTPENRAKYGTDVMPATGFYTPWPVNWKATAKKFTCPEAFELTSTDELITALLIGFPVVVGRQGHSICYVRPIIKGGQINVIYVNSWSEDWGMALAGFRGGFGVDSLSYVRQASQYAFALRTTNAGV